MENTDTINDIVNDAVGSVGTGVKDAEKAAADAELDRKINEAAAELSEAEAKLNTVEDAADKVDEVKDAVSDAIADVTKSEETEASKEVTLETLINDYNDSILKIGSLEEQNAKLLEENSKLNADNKLALARLAQGFRESQSVPASSLVSETDKSEEFVDSTVKEILDHI